MSTLRKCVQEMKACQSAVDPNMNDSGSMSSSFGALAGKSYHVSELTCNLISQRMQICSIGLDLPSTNLNFLSTVNSSSREFLYTSFWIWWKSIVQL